MKKCKKCNSLSGPDNFVKFIVHRITTHGDIKNVFFEQYPELKEQIETLLEEEHKTGRVSAYTKFGSSKYLPKATS